MGLQPILERLYYGQWEMCCKLHRSVDADAWCKQALNTEGRTTLNDSLHEGEAAFSLLL